MQGAETTRDRILAATMQVIDEHGEAAVRVVDVAAAAGVTQGMVNYHFRTRDMLVLEAQLNRYTISFANDVDIALASVGSIATRDDVLAFATSLTRDIVDPQRDAPRRSRLNALGYAAGSAALWATISQAHTGYIDGLTSVFDALGRRGLLRPDVDPRAAATMVSAYTFGLVLAQLDHKRPAPDQLATVIVRFIESLLVD